MARVLARAASWASPVVRRLCTVASEAPVSESASTAAVAEASKAKHLYRRLSVLGGAPKGAVSKAMNKWLREGRRIRAINVMKFVKELRNYKRYGHALELMEWMETRGMNMSYSNYAVRLALICKVEGIDSAEKYFSNLSGPAKNRLTYGALLNCYCTQKMEEKALALFDKMKELNYISNALSYSNMMALYMKLGKPEKVPLLSQEMVDKGIPRNAFTYNLLMNSYAALNDIESVERIFKEIKECDATNLQWPIYSTLASVCISAGLTEKAKSALVMLEENMDRKDRQCFHFLINLYAGTDNLEGVNRVWSSLKSAFPTTLNMSYFTMLQALSRLNELDALAQCFHEWESSCVTYDIRLANILFAAYLRRDMLKEADSLWETLIHRGAEPDFRTFELFIDYYLNKKEFDLALRYLNDAASKVKSEEWKPNKEKVDAFLRYFKEQKDVDSAEAFCQNLKKLNCLDPDIHNSLLQIYMSS
ncbi:hypothetical protein Taro_032436 [Colocasia esculenta]|uniref:Pentatricopeptide repeat-containing protein n=1 Tax=Colocasia esculenta TaxID=4460 RepID=A0A843W9F5_COLES|nr:hypothetical protein [Colocasia esculenta]